MNLVFPQMSGQEEGQAVLDTEAAAAAADPIAGDALFVVSNKWFTQWCQYSGFQYDPARKKPKVVSQDQPGPRPGPIDNSDLLAEQLNSCDLTAEQQAGVVLLRDKLADKVHFWMFHEPTWKLLKEWYGIAGPEIQRKYHSIGRRLGTDSHQLHFRVVARLVGGGEQEVVVGASSLCKLTELKDMACKALGLVAENYDVYDFRGSQQGANLEGTTFKTLVGNKLQDQQALLLVPRGQQVQQPAGGTPSSPVMMLPLPAPATSPLRLSSPRGSSGFMATSPMSPLSRSFDRAPGWAEDAVYEDSGRERGLAGLGNLGNTCFMNSSLQCLAHSLPLMQTFLTGAYKRDLNKDNPLSLGGKLALAFAALMEKLWRGGVAHVSPKLFKWQLAKFAPQFSGYAQQDSQELLAFLLDGLHEDLNRITDKPYVEDKDSDGRPDEEVAAEAWSNYRRRNDSVIVDAFQGLYRSVLTCPQCAYQSIKFDPLMYLSLPLPSSKMRSITFTAVYIDGSALPRQYGIQVPKSATVGQLYAGIAQLVGLATQAPEEVLLLTQFNDGNFVIYGDLKARVSSIEDLRSRVSLPRSPSGLYLIYIYPSPGTGPCSGGHPVHIYHKAARTSNYLIPGTPLFMPGAQLAALNCVSLGSETMVAPGGGRDAIDDALQQLLRPFHKHQVPEPVALESAAKSPGSSEQQQQRQAPWPAPMDEGPSSVAAAVELAPPAEAMASAPAPNCEAMEVEERPQPNGTMEVAAVSKPRSDDSWLNSLPGLPTTDGTAADALMSSAAAPMPAVADSEPFDMWSAQRKDATKAPAAAATASSPPFLLKCAKHNSYGPGLSTYNVKLEVPEGGEPLVLVAEWQEVAAQLYNPDPLLHAEKDTSALALAEKQRDGGKSVSLADCLETFLHPEQLDAEDSWYCGKCKQHVQADKKLDLWSLPDVLVVHLKRFSYSRYSRDKLDTLVDFPLRDLDMAPYLLSKRQQAQRQQSGQVALSTRYDLYAVSNHYGGMGGGHYTAYCRLLGKSGSWYTFDDSHVRHMEESGVKTSAAYVLFYRRQGAQPDEDVEAFLERAAAEQRQEPEMGQPVAGKQQDAAAAAAGQLEKGTPFLAGQEGLPLLPPPLPLLPSTSGSSLGKRQPPETIEEEEEEDPVHEDSRDDIPAAGAIEID